MILKNIDEKIVVIIRCDSKIIKLKPDEIVELNCQKISYPKAYVEILDKLPEKSKEQKEKETKKQELKTNPKRRGRRKKTKGDTNDS